MTEHPTPTPASLFAIFCDDIRREITQKLTYIGVYDAKLLVTEFPATLPKFVVMMHLHAPLDMEIDSVDFILMKDDVPVQEMKVDVAGISKDPTTLPEAAGSSRVSIRAVFEISPLRFDGPCYLRARARIKPTNDFLRGGSLRVDLLNPTVGQPSLFDPA